ncbi:MAG: hypothetical protein MAG431_02552 [Chloroflexi bacterium]|nr:hypothetical protein [Chloroflexota bacterium]
MQKLSELKKAFTRPVVIFLTIAFLPAWVLFLIPLFVGESGSITHQIVVTISWALAMWMPGIAALLTTRFVEKSELATLRLGKMGRKGLYFWAWLLPILMVLLTGVLTWAFGLGTFDPELSLIKESLAQMPENTPLSPSTLLAIQILASITLAPLINTLFALGEELGWRGYLLPRLLPLGQKEAILVSGIIWGIWHAPAVAQGLNYPQHPVLGIFLMIGFTVLLGIFLAWLYLETRSPWAPALGHGTINAVAGLPMIVLLSVDITWGGTIASLTGWVSLALVAGYLFWRGHLPVAEG